MKKDAYYFPHFSNARLDRKILRIRKELGIEGYGIYFMVLEVLRDTEEFKYPLEDLDLLADEFGTSEQKVRTVITNYKLFDVDEQDNFFSVRFDEFMQPYLKMKEQRRKAGIASAAKRKLLSENEQPFNDRSTTVQQRKVKESKIDIPTYEDFKTYALEKKADVNLESLKLKYDSWVENGWKDGYDKKIKNWKSKLLNTLPHLKEKFAPKRKVHEINTDIQNNPNRLKFN